jgi:hypothetical protein
MSISLFRKDFINLDSFYDPTDSMPLLKSLTEDMLSNGFKDVGPTITKIVISDEDFTRFIDEFIVYHYDTEQGSMGKGAYGIRPWNVDKTHLQEIITLAGVTKAPVFANLPKTTWSPEGQQTTVEIDDFYLDGFGTWDGVTAVTDIDAAMLSAGTPIPASPYYNQAWSKTACGVDSLGASDTIPVGLQKSLVGLTHQWYDYLATEFPMNGEDAVGKESSFGLDYYEPWSVNAGPDLPTYNQTNWLGPALEDYNGAVWDTSTILSKNVYESVNSILPLRLVYPSTDPADVYYVNPANGVAEKQGGVIYAYDDGHALWATLGQGIGWVGQEYYGSNVIFGPNTELFSYLNPHPKSMVVGKNGRGVYRKGRTYIYDTYKGVSNVKAPGAGPGDPGGVFDWNPGYHSLGDIGALVYRNEFNKIKKLICTGNRDVTMSPYESSSTHKKVIKYFERRLANGDIEHEFYLSGENDSTFFPPGTKEDIRQVSLLQLGVNEISTQDFGLQLGDIYTFTFVMEDIEQSKVLSIPQIEYCSVNVVVNSLDAGELANDLHDRLVNTKFAGKLYGKFDVTISDEVSSSLQFKSIRPEYILHGLGTYGQPTTFDIDVTGISPIINGDILITIKYALVHPAGHPNAGSPVYDDDDITISLNGGDTSSIIKDKVHLGLLNYSFSETFILDLKDDVLSSSKINVISNRVLTSIIIKDINTSLSSPWTNITISPTASADVTVGGFNNSVPTRYTPIKNSLSTTDLPLSLSGGFIGDFTNRSLPISTTNGGAVVWSGSTTNPSAVYVKGYVPSFRIGPFNYGIDSGSSSMLIDGLNSGDKLLFNFTGLVNEDAVSPWLDNTGFDLLLTFVAESNLTVLGALLSVKKFLLLNEYLYNYMTIVIDGNYLVCSYNYKSSAYMVRSKRGPGDYGLLNIPSHYWDTDLGLNASTVTNYNLNSVLGSNYTAGGVPSTPGSTIYMTGRNSGDVIVGADYDSIVVSDITNVDTTTYKHPDFSVSVNFIVKSLRSVESLHTEMVDIVSGSSNTESKIRIAFHYANDLGTFANPPSVNQHLYYSPLETATTNANREQCSYAISYKQTVLQSPYTKRPDGPNCSFRDVFKTVHPWMTTSNSDNFDDYEIYNGVCYFDNFRKITDYSIGPVVLETDDTAPIIGLGDRQPFRIRFDVVSGEEVMDTSQYISPDHRSVDLNDTSGISNTVQKSNHFDYLQVNIATQYQLKSDGTVTNITKYTSDIPKSRLVRPSGYLGEIKPQFSMYSKAQAHLINPSVYRLKDDSQISTMVNVNAGRVGIRSNVYSLDATDMKKREYQFNMISNSFHNDVSKAPTYKFSGMSDEYSIKKGILDDGEFKYENSFLRGSSMELIEDAPYTTTFSRMGKGWFKRDGKVKDDVRGQYPMNYHLTILNHGISLYMQDQSASGEDDDFAWFVIQRHVDQTTGLPDWTSETQPIHCMYMSSKLGTLWSNFEPYFTDSVINVNTGISNQNIYNSSSELIQGFWIEAMKNPEYNELDLHLQSRFKRFVVREIDTVKPWDKHVYAGVNAIDSHAVINPLEQIAFNEDGKLIIHFPTKLANQRVIFGSSEIDMIAFTDAGAVNEDSYTSSVRYGDDKERFYKGGMSTRPFGNGMRILFLVSGYGVQSTYGFVVD